MKDEFIEIDGEDWEEYEDKTRQLNSKADFWVNLIAACTVIVMIAVCVWRPWAR